MATMPKVLIVGAGIGGLTAAIASRQVGLEVEVFERAEVLREVGAGIGLSANAMRVLLHLGLAQQVVDRGTVIQAVVGYTAEGATLSRMSTTLSDTPTVCLHRAELQQVLLAALPPDCVHRGQEFVDFKTDGAGVTARFSSGRTAVGDVLVGADGLRSKVRARLLGDGEPIYRGYQCWRGVCHHPVGDLLTETFGPGLRFGLLPIGRRGTAWWCTANEPELAPDGPEGAMARLLRWIGNWHQPIPDVISETDPTTIIKSAIYDRPPVKTWSRGNCTLLGDAADPTTPNMGQGGGMAIEDGAMLARCLANHSNPATALRVYERLRHPRTARITRVSRLYGVMGQWENLGAVWVRNALLRLGSGKAGTKGYLEFVGYDPYKVSLGGK